MIDPYTFAEAFHESHQSVVKLNVEGYERLSWEDLPPPARHALLATTKFMIPAVDSAYAMTFADFILAVRERPTMWRAFLILSQERDAGELARGVEGFMKAQRARKQVREHP